MRDDQIQFKYTLTFKKDIRNKYVFVYDKELINTWFFPLKSTNSSNLIELKDSFTPHLFKNGKFEILKTESTLEINWSIQLSDFSIRCNYDFSKTRKLKIKCEIISIINPDNFIDILTLLFYRLQMRIIYPNRTLDELFIQSISGRKIEFYIEIKAENEKIYSALTNKSHVAKIFAKYPEIDLKNFKYTWGYIDEGPNNLIYFSENESLIYDFYLDYNPIGIAKWKIKKDENKNNSSHLQFIFQDLVLENEVDPLETFNSYRIGWLLLLYKVKDFSENDSLTISIKSLE